MLSSNNGLGVALEPWTKLHARFIAPFDLFWKNEKVISTTDFLPIRHGNVVYKAVKCLIGESFRPFHALKVFFLSKNDGYTVSADAALVNKLCRARISLKNLIIF